MSPRTGERAAPASLLQSWRSWIVVAALLVALLLVVLLYERPAHTFTESGHLGAWRAALSRVESHPDGCVDPYAVGVTHLAGFGAVGRICLSHGSPSGSTEVIFRPASGDFSLAYVKGLPLPYDECSSPLGAGWWQVTSINPSTMGCPRGFTFDPGP
ncbi:MAG: hypothetical protein ACHQFZ_05890 [Acidimicrobiales bacterium]